MFVEMKLGFTITYLRGKRTGKTVSLCVYSCLVDVLRIRTLLSLYFKLQKNKPIPKKGKTIPMATEVMAAFLDGR